MGAVLTDALAELGAVEEAVLGEVVEALLDGGPAGGAVGAADELEALERVRGGEARSMLERVSCCCSRN